jgi:transcriptional regulator with XRE-family HTH domain
MTRRLVQTGQRAVRRVGQSLHVAKTTDRPFVEEVPRLLKARGMSIRTLAASVGVSDSHLSRVLRQADYKTPSTGLTTRVAEAFGLPVDYFPEFREAYVVQRVKADPQLRNRLYARLKTSSS